MAGNRRITQARKDETSMRLKFLNPLCKPIMGVILSGDSRSCASPGHYYRQRNNRAARFLLSNQTGDIALGLSDWFFSLQASPIGSQPLPLSSQNTPTALNR